ncbi:MAG: metallophosphoesterase [Proteobacteria bacterium]|jgi:3',5'-cyclic AMP phosphodiesterase CpdA|nr:metallophosphoesterase [Pseudomonadota bacterium]
MNSRILFLTLIFAACPGRQTGTVDSDSLPPTPTTCDGSDKVEVTVTIAPYVQWVTTESAWIVWETDGGTESRVDWGTDETLGEFACGELVPVLPGGDPLVAATLVHEVQLSELEPSTTYYYRSQTGATTGSINHFQTAPLTGDEAPTRLVAISDSQRDDSNPQKLQEVIDDGVIDYIRGNYGADLATELDLVLVTGDLVDNGWLLEEWQEEFFGPSAALMAEVPFYPVFGNHEGGTPFFQQYFHLPDDGDTEHYYTIDHSNVRIVGLDSNLGWNREAQLEWLDAVLARTCADTDIDFLFAQCHHPWRSETWLTGESEWSGEVVARLEQFSTTCGKPSIHFFGHTHSYSRGQSRDHQHLMVNVASAGGALDYWGAHTQTDYDEFTVSRGSHGFVFVEVQAGDSPEFTMRRLSRGTPDSPLDNEETDKLTIRQSNVAPAAPVADDPGTITCGTTPTFSASPFSDSDGNAHQGTHWQVAADCKAFSKPIVERWRQRHNWISGVDLQANDNLTDEPFADLMGNLAQQVCFRVRYRDDGLLWSDWSTGRSVAIEGC